MTLLIAEGLIILALAAYCLLLSLRLSAVEQRARRALGLAQSAFVEATRATRAIDAERTQLIRAELQLDAVSNRLGRLREELSARLSRLERGEMTEDDVVKLLSKPPVW